MSIAPFQRPSATSREAAISIMPVVLPAREQVLLCLRRFGPATDERIIEFTHLPASTARPRRVELVRDGLVRAADGLGRTASGRAAQLWEVVPTGPEQGALL